MPLIKLWNANPDTISEMSIEQIVATAGDGNLKDGSSCSGELREYFSQILSDKIKAYIERCLTSSFVKSGLVLQDLVNELGRRLDYNVTNGRYQGIVNAAGFDGIWESPENRTIIAEVKTTDTYRISLDTIAGYRDRLKSENRISGEASILIVVGREDTGELEAQVRGSKHAWDIRLISADSLVKLVQLKEKSDSQDTGRKIRNLLNPVEYTRLDEMVDVMFTAATDVEAGAIETAIDEADVAPSADEPGLSAQELKALRQRKRNEIVQAIEKNLQTKLISKSRALHWDSAHKTRIAIATSKHYDSGYPYWYAYHPQWDEFLSDGNPAYYVLGCMDLPIAFAIPRSKMKEILPHLSTTATEREKHWNVNIVQEGEKFVLLLPKASENMQLTEYQVKLAES